MAPLPDTGAARLAARQHGVATAAQLAAAGLGRKALRARVRDGRFLRLHQGVYLIASPAPQFHREAAAVLAAGPHAVLSHDTAAALWGLRANAPDPVEVTLLNAHRRSRNGIRIHQTALDPQDVRHRHGLPLTSPARTLLDLAATAPPAHLATALNEARVQRLATPHELAALNARSSSHSGTTQLVRALDTTPGMTRSEAERRLLALVAQAGLARPIPNARVAGHEVDLHWPEHGLVVEFDSWQFHSTRAAFERDRRKDAALLLAGQRVVRVTDRQVADGLALAARLGALLATPPPRAAAAPAGRGR